jgi:hypothetical protein
MRTSPFLRRANPPYGPPKGINPKKGLRKRSFLRIVLISLYG